MKTQAKEDVFWETSTESIMEVGQWMFVGEGCVKQEALELFILSWFVNQIANGDFLYWVIKI